MVTQAPLITAADLLRFGASSDFLEQFRPRQLTVLMVAGGALGAATFQWKRIDEEHYSATIYSEAGAAWSVTLPDLAYATLAFAAGGFAPHTSYNRRARRGGF